MTELTPEQAALFGPPNLAYLATVNADGSPHVSPLWADARDGLIVLNTADGRTKVENVRRDPRVSVAIHEKERPHPPLAIQGTVIEVTPRGAEVHMQELARRYTGEEWDPVEGQVRLLLVIRPDRVLGWT
ncbi:MAG: TIGR03618 family F420-dependent PPOX class oxidoreductase [Actinomycetota bacterium]